MVQLKNKIGMLLMEAGVSDNKQKLHKASYFREMLASSPDINERLRSLLRQCREMVVRLGKMEAALIYPLQQDRFGGARGTIDEHSCGGTNHRADLGAGNRRGTELLVDQESHQLLRAVWRPAKFRRSYAAYATIEATQQTFADYADRK
jgi:hypothetical protein